MAYNAEARVKEKEMSEQLAAMIGQPFDNKKVREVLATRGVKRVANPDASWDESIVWIPKASVRIDAYRPSKLNKLTGLSYPAQDEWIIGAVEFLALRSDDRIKSPFPSPLPMSLAMSSMPQGCIDAHGLPDLDEEHERPGSPGGFWPGENRARTSRSRSPARIARAR